MFDYRSKVNHSVNNSAQFSKLDMSKRWWSLQCKLGIRTEESLRSAIVVCQCSLCNGIFVSITNMDIKKLITRNYVSRSLRCTIVKLRPPNGRFCLTYGSLGPILYINLLCCLYFVQWILFIHLNCVFVSCGVFYLNKRRF